MDLNDYWQENKRFVLSVAGGAVAFLIGLQIVDSWVGEDLRRERVRVASLQRELADSRYVGKDLSAARAENEALKQAFGTLRAAAVFRARPDYRLDPGKGSPGNQYFAQVSRVREDLLRLAGRRNVRLPEDLGLPALAPTKPEELERHLEALDLIERVVRVAIEEGVPRIENMEVRLDPGLFSRKGVGRVETTRIKLKLVGPSGPMTRTIVRTQTDETGQPLLIDELQIVPQRSKLDEAQMDVTFAIARPSELEPEVES